MEQLASQILLVSSCWALIAAALRLVSQITPSGLERVVAAAPLAAAAAVGEALLLGTLGLGASPIVLAVAALLTWVAVRLMTSAPRIELLELVGSWWKRSSATTRITCGAIVGTAIGWSIGQAHFAEINIDGTYYHLPEIVAWTQDGRVGAVHDIIPAFPVGDYPVTYEVLLTWAMGISRSYAPSVVATPAFLLLFLGAGVLLSRELSIPRWTAGLALSAVVSLPIVVIEGDGFVNDVSGLAWLSCAAALCVRARAQPGLLAPGVVAAGLAAGTKTTLAPLALVVVVIGVVVAWEHAARLRMAIAAASGVAVGVGGIWYLRNLVSHGSPVWPFLTVPWGDPKPTGIASFHSLLERPRASLRGNLGAYRDLTAGGLLLIPGALAAFSLARQRVVLGLSAATFAGLATWVASPAAGGSDLGLGGPVDKVHYLLPTFAVAALTLAVAARCRRARPWANVVLAGALAANLAGDIFKPFVYHPPAVFVAVGAVAGAAVLALLAPSLPRRALSRVAAVSLIGVAMAGALAVVATGFSQRHVRTATTFDAELLRWFFARDGVDDDSRRIVMGPELSGPLTGDRLQRAVELVDFDASCAELARTTANDWLIIRPDDFSRVTFGYRVGECAPPNRRVTQVGIYRVFEPLRR